MSITPGASRATHLPRRSLLLFAALLTVVSMGGPGCGGGATGTPGMPGGPPPPVGPFYETLPQVDIPVTVTLPAGTSLLVSELHVDTLAGTVTPAPDGTAQVPTFGGGPQLALVVDGDGDMVLSGWVPVEQGTPGPHVLSARSTGEVLMYFAFGLPLLEEAVRAELIRRLRLAPELDALAQAIATALAASPKALVTGDANVKAALAQALARLRAGGSPVTPQKLFIDPADQQSGVTVHEVGINQIRIRNLFRRRAVAFLQRLSYEVDGVETPAGADFGRYDITAPGSVGSVLGAVREGAIQLGTLSTGALPTYATETDPIDAPLFPAAASRTNYRLTVLGAGEPGQGPPVSGLPMAQQDAFVEVMTATILLDMVFPVLTTIWAPQGSQATQAWLGGVKPGDFLDIVGVLKDNLAEYHNLVLAGDAYGAATLVLSAMRDDSVFREKVFTSISVFLFARYGEGALRGDALLSKVFNTLKAFDMALTGLDTAAQVLQVRQCRPVQTFDVSALKSRVTLTPAATTITQYDVPPPFQARVPDATNDEAPLVKFHFTCSGQFGHLIDAAGHSGTDFENSSGLVSYAWDSGFGTDTITVEGLIDSPGATPDVPLGKTTATVTVWEAKVELTPVDVELNRGGSSTFQARVPAVLQDGNPLVFRWSCGGTRGTFTIGSDAYDTPLPAATYRAWSGDPGTDTVTVDVYSTRPGGRVHLGRAEATVRVVAGRVRTVYGSCYAVAKDPGETCCSYFVFVPKQPGAVSYLVHTYGYNDTAFYGTDQDWFFTASSPPSWAQDRGSEYGLGLAGGCGSAPFDMGACLSYYEGRFAGMIVEVTVTFAD